MEQIDLRKEYLFKGNNIGCLVIHGFTSTPAELRELSEKIRDEKGYTVLGVRLKGHGTTITEMEQCKYMDWIDSAVEGLEKLKETCDKIYVIGHSMGGVIALYIAENYPVDKVVVLSPALVNKGKATDFAFIIKHFMKYATWPPEERPEEETKYLLGYDRAPIRSVDQLNKMAKKVRKELNRIVKPTLVVYSHKDNTVDEKSIEMIQNNLGTKEIQTVFLNECRHNITIECEKGKVFEAVLKFI